METDCILFGFNAIKDIEAGALRKKVPVVQLASPRLLTCHPLDRLREPINSAQKRSHHRLFQIAMEEQQREETRQAPPPLESAEDAARHRYATAYVGNFGAGASLPQVQIFDTGCN